VSHLLNYILWLPFLGGIALLFVPEDKIKKTALGVSFLTLILNAVLYFNFDNTIAGMQPQFTIKESWIKNFSINYFLNVDGISLSLLLLNALLFVICILCSWNIQKKIRSYFTLLLFLQTAIFGVFLAQDFFLFYLFWEAMLIPMFFLIAIWGGDNREYAATKFIIYTFFGSILMLVGIIALYYASGKGVQSFDIIALQGGKFHELTFSFLGSSFAFDKVVFWIMFLGFAIKVPIFPFHTWLPHAHVQAPTAVSVILAGILLKMGSYGFLRIAFPIFPEAAKHYSYVIGLLGLISIVYGAFCALAQTDIKKLVAYSSVSHMGFVMLGLASMTTYGITGAVMQMFNHGVSSAMMFLLIGILYERSHHRWIVKPDGTRGFSGLAIQMPKYTVIFLLGMFASIGLPGLAGFVSELLIFLGSFKTFTTFTIIASVGLLYGAAYLLWMYRRMFFGPVSTEVSEYEDMTKLETAYMLPLCALVLIFGVCPSLLSNTMKASINLLVTQLAQ
jgi:NADH-quinone oxidoreductase subunit M